MKKRTKKALELNRETVQNLELRSSELRGAVGGTNEGSDDTDGNICLALTFHWAC